MNLQHDPEIEEIAARLAVLPHWTCRPRDICLDREVERGADPVELAAAGPSYSFLGWELEPELGDADRGLSGHLVATLIHLRRDADVLLRRVRALEAQLGRRTDQPTPTPATPSQEP